MSAQDATTTTIADMLTIQHNTTGTAGTGFGSAILFKIETPTPTNVDAGRLQVSSAGSDTYGFAVRLRLSGTIGTAWSVAGNGDVTNVGHLSINSSNAGMWTTPGFSAGDFTGGGSMTWTVASGDVTTYAYTIVDHKMTVAFNLVTTTANGGDHRLLIKIPASKTATKRMTTAIWDSENSVTAIGYCEVLASATNITCYKTSAAPNWGNFTDLIDIFGQITFEIN